MVQCHQEVPNYEPSFLRASVTSVVNHPAAQPDNRLSIQREAFRLSKFAVDYPLMNAYSIPVHVH